MRLLTEKHCDENSGEFLYEIQKQINHTNYLGCINEKGINEPFMALRRGVFPCYKVELLATTSYRSLVTPVFWVKDLKGHSLSSHIQKGKRKSDN